MNHFENFSHVIDEINFIRIEANIHYVLSFQGFLLFITFNQTWNKMKRKKSIWICSVCNQAS